MDRRFKVALKIVGYKHPRKKGEYKLTAIEYYGEGWYLVTFRTRRPPWNRYDNKWKYHQTLDKYRSDGIFSRIV